MHKRPFSFIFMSLLFLFTTSISAMEKTFYIMRTNSASSLAESKNLTKKLSKHKQAIDTIISQAYQVDQHGAIWGSLNLSVEKWCQHNNKKLMAMVTNQGYSAKKLHAFLASPHKQQRAINGLITACNHHKLYGIQIDFEHVGIEDESLFTRFYQKLSTAMHKQGFALSVAIFPATQKIQPTGYSMTLSNNWSGGYDYSALGKASDFVTLMAYDQHVALTTPGPVAGLPWVKAIIDYAAKSIPKDKLSLGIPTYSNYWSVNKSGGNYKAIGKQISFSLANSILEKFNTPTHWSKKQQVPYAIFSNNFLNEYLFIEDARSFEQKMQLVEKYHLRGFSVWRLGTEDPGIWGKIAAQKQAA